MYVLMYEYAVRASACVYVIISDEPNLNMFTSASHVVIYIRIVLKCSSQTHKEPYNGIIIAEIPIVTICGVSLEALPR